MVCVVSIICIGIVIVVLVAEGVLHVPVQCCSPRRQAPKVDTFGRWLHLLPACFFFNSQNAGNSVDTYFQNKGMRAGWGGAVMLGTAQGKFITLSNASRM